MCAPQYSAAFCFPFSTATSNSQSVLESSPSRSVRLNRDLQRPTKGMWERGGEKNRERESLNQRETFFFFFFFSRYCVFKETSVQTTFPQKTFHSCEPDRSDTQIQSRTTQTDTLSLCFCKRWKVEVVTQRKAQINTYPPGFRNKQTHKFWLTHEAEVAFPP